MLRIRAVEPMSGHWLRLTLTDGTVIERQVGDLLRGPVFASVRSDPSSFRAVTASDGTVTWAGGIDLDPDVLIWGGPPRGDAGSRPVPVLELQRPSTD